MYVECRPYVTSVVYNNDLICRTSFLAIDNLRNELLDCLTRVKTNKYEVLIHMHILKDTHINTYYIHIYMTVCLRYSKRLFGFLLRSVVFVEAGLRARYTHTHTFLHTYSST